MFSSPDSPGSSDLPGSSGSPWRICLLGGLRLERGRDAITRFRSQKIGALLAYLALFPHRLHAREELADLLWPDADVEAARVNLRTALASLRRQLEPPGDLANSVLRTEGRTQVSLNPDAFTTDVAAFEAALAAARPGTSLDQQTAHLRGAVELYGGPLLPGCYEPWALTERDRLAEAYIGTLTRLSGLYERAGNGDQALAWARQAVSVDPLREEAHGVVIRLLMESGQAALARRQFDTLCDLLKDRIGDGAQPGPEIKALLRDGKTTASPLSRPARPTPETIVTPNAPSSQPAPAPQLKLQAAPAPVHLPLALNRFFGREEETAWLSNMFRNEKARLVTLAGPGGAGKTRLAVETARALTDYFHGGVWFVPLADLRDAERLYAQIAATLDLPRAGGAEPLDQIVGALTRSNAPAPVLFVLDNFEQIVEDGATLAQALLERAPHLSLLVTSRQRLLIEGERAFSLAPLPAPNHPGNPERLQEFPSVQLFVNRAQAARPDFQLTARNAADIASLCARLEGVPLALELAAAWSRTLTPAQILERLARRFDLLISRRRDLPGRHSTLRATMNWSYQLLQPPLQTFFAQLSVFRGGWTLEAAESVTGESGGALLFLAELQERSLIVSEETTEGGAMRFRMLETLREFAAEQGAEQDALRLRHAAYFAHLADEAERALHGADASAWLDLLEREHDNFRAVLEWSCDTPEGRQIGMALAGALHRFWYIRGHLAEGRRWLERVLACPTDLEETTPAGAKALAAAAGLAMVQGEYDLAASLYTNALNAHRINHDNAGEAFSLCQLGVIAARNGDHAAALKLYEESIVLCGDDEGSKAYVLKCLGNVLLDQGESAKAEALFRKGLAVYRRIGDKRGIAMALYELSQLALADNNHWERANDYLQEYLSLARQIKDVAHTARALSSLGQLAQYQGDYALARARLAEGLSLFRDGDYDIEMGRLLQNFTDLLIAQNEPERAVRAQAATNALRHRFGDLLTPLEQARKERIVTKLRAALGSATFDKIYAAGEAMGLLEIIAYAVEDALPRHDRATLPVA